MEWLATGIAVLLAAVALRLLLPRATPPPRWRRWLARRAQHLADRLRDRDEPRPDPFEALRLQMRLGVVAEQIRALESDPLVYAKAHRLMAARAAYDDLLDDACRLAGVPVEARGVRGAPGRYADELELASRGWSW